MNTILIDMKYWSNVSGQLIGQKGSTMVMEVETLPNCVYQIAENLNKKVQQRCLPGTFKGCYSIAEILEARALLEEMGDYAKKATSLNELKLMKQATDAELALVALYEEVTNG
ncbi:MAG: hypothetical protein AB1Z19_08810 [Eubacteriales bacterium]